MATIVVRHKVSDIDAWLQGHAEREALFAPAVTGFKTFQDAADKNSVLMVVEVTDMEKLAAIINDPNNQPIKDRHTVIEPILVSMQVDL